MMGAMLFLLANRLGPGPGSLDGRLAKSKPVATAGR